MTRTGTATISACGTYRYTLHRQIHCMLRWTKPCLFVMLNPSTANANKDDPTIRRCVSFALRERCTSLTVVNLFALRATDPAELTKHPDPFGPENAQHLGQQLREHRIGIIIAAWGARPIPRRWDDLITLTKIAVLNSGALCLGMTADVHPRHPLYVKGDQPLIPWARPCPPNSLLGDGGATGLARGGLRSIKRFNEC